MMRKIWMCLVCVSAVSCQTATSGGSFEAFGTQWANAVCAYYERCELAASKEACVEFFDVYVSLYLDASSALGQSFAQGKVKYDSAAASRCVQAIEVTSCSMDYNETWLGNPDCRAFVSGQLNDGAACNAAECAPGSSCSFPTPNAICGGTCKRQVGVGGAATSASDCDSGLDLRDGKCVATPKVGEACAYVCEPSALCIAGKCEKPGSVGEACSSTKLCTNGLKCSSGQCVKPGIVGDACNKNNKCQIGLRCDLNAASSVCKNLIAEGEECPGEDCALGLRCQLDDSSSTLKSTCQKISSLGDPCKTYGCVDGSFCDKATKICKAELAEGSTCDAANGDDQCAFSSCMNGTCPTRATCP